MSIHANRLYSTLVEIIRIPSTSGHEEHVRRYLEQQLTELGLTPHVDDTGNLIATLPGTGKPLLLNAHMDRVPPGLGHEPVLRAGILYSDGTTNLGADDAAGLAIILEVLRRTVEQQKAHPPLVIVFTVQEETGLCGASHFDNSALAVSDGLIFDNAFEAGTVVSQGAAYEAFKVKISGRTGHPGKDLSSTVNALEIFRAAKYPHGSLADDQTRINIGSITGGTARNAIPATVTLEGEIRSFEPAARLEHYKQAIRKAFEQAASQFGGQVEITFNTHSTGYTIGSDEPLLLTYRRVLEQRGATLKLRPTFIGSDTSGFRPAIRAFTISTGVVPQCHQNLH
ncbi:M20/M25/M40 family metallo-hydrolase [Ktedonosporobacter rubrisoli]|nr:M20/M25/M40 family metallo-hydrolase [Ktedonosporobacter rubrisoli]